MRPKFLERYGNQKLIMYSKISCLWRMYVDTDSAVNNLSIEPYNC